MTVDVEALIAPVSDEAPAGPDLSYDAARQDIEAAFDRSISDDGDSESDVDWRKTSALILEQAAQTRDMWLPVYLMRAGAKAGNLDTVETGAALLAGLCENLWDTVHPELADYGFQGRKGPCESLTRLGEFINPFRAIPLISHPRLGVHAARDFERFKKNGDSEDGYGMFRALMAETADDDLNAVIARLDAIKDAIHRADVVMTAHADGDTSTNFKPTYDMLSDARAAIASFLKAAPAIAEASGADDWGDWSNGESGASSGSSETSGGPGFSGRINSREDVLRALDAIADYYARKEPGSAVPFALRRAREWVSLDFMAILEDIAPGSMDDARRVLMSSRSGGGQAATSDWEEPSSGSSSEGDGW